MRRCAAAVLILLSACADPRSDAPDVTGLRVIAVLPFTDQTGTAGFDGDEFANILASELAKVGGIRVIRPAQIRAACENDESILTANDAIRIGRKVRADAVLACAVTDYDPYDPPKVAVSAQFLRVEAGPLSGQDLDRMLQSASWRRGPLAMSRDRASHALGAFEEVYDSRDKHTRHALQAYVEGRVDLERDFLAVQSRYLQFVSSRMVNRVLAHGS